MSGLLSLGKYQWLNPNSGLDPVLLAHYLRVTQSVVESVTGLVFGSEVASVTDMGSHVWRIEFHGGSYDVGQQVRLLGGGVSAEPFTVLDAGVTTVEQADAGDFFDAFFEANPDALAVATGTAWIEVESTIAIAPTKILPIVEYVGQAQSLHVYCYPRPVFSVISVQTRRSEDVLWSESYNVITLNATDFELFKQLGLGAGVQIKRASLPREAEGGEYLVKRMMRKVPSGVKVTYAAGFYSQIPADLESAAQQIAGAVVTAADKGGMFASENLDYYSYSALTYDQLSALPYAALSILRRYARS
jgi:hypothetical protein